MPSALEDVAAGFRAVLLARERVAASEMVRAYGAGWRRVREQLDGVQAAMRAAQQSGADATSLMHQQRRLSALERQIAAEMRDFAALATDLTEAGQLQAAQAAINNSAALIQTAEQAAGLPLVFDRLPVEAIQEFIGFASNGSPLRNLFDALGEEISRGIRDELAAAIATGRNPRETARAIRRLYSMGMQRALVIARTEQIRAYREAVHQTYLRNADVLDGWIWLSAANRRTCAACWAMHGTFHPLKERLDDHPQGRCVAVPVVKGHKPTTKSGEDLFRLLPEAEQRAVLGAGAWEAWKAGAVNLSQFAGQRSDPEWGTMRYRRSLREILGSTEALRWIRQARKK